jgi:hypothetical protein
MPVVSLVDKLLAIESYVLRPLRVKQRAPKA